MRKTITRLGLALAVTASVAAFAQQPVVMRLSHQVPPAHHLSTILAGFAADVKARTKGQVEVQLFGSEQLAKARENFSQVARGAIESAVAVNLQWGATIPEMNVLTIPYFFTDLERIRKFPGSEARKFLDAKLEARGVKSIAWFYITRESIFTSSPKPIIALADFKGLKIRGLNKLIDEALVAVGAAPSAMPGSEVYQALGSGVIDAGLTDVSAALSRKYFEVQKYGTVTPFFTVYFHLYVNPGWWNGLTPENRAAIEAAGRKAELDAIPITEQTAKEAVTGLKAKGMVLHIQTADEHKAWRAAMQKPVIDAFLKSSPTDGAKLIELVNKL